MASINEYVQIIADQSDKPFDAGFLSDLKFSFKYYRALLARRDIERNLLSPLYLQSIVVPLVLVDEADSCVVQAGCEMLRTEVQIPKPIRLKSNELFKYVGYANKVNGTNPQQAFGYIELEAWRNSRLNRYTGNHFKHNYTNGYIYVLGSKRLKFLGIEGVFEDPLALPYCTCQTDDDEFPIPMDVAILIIQSMINGEYKIMSHSVEVKTTPTITQPTR